MVLILPLLAASALVVCLAFVSRASFESPREAPPAHRILIC